MNDIYPSKTNVYMSFDACSDSCKSSRSNSPLFFCFQKKSYLFFFKGWFKLE